MLSMKPQGGGERKEAPKEVLIAKPVVGEVDHKADLKELMKQFPKTLEYLAR